MALAKVRSNGMIELPDDVLTEFGIREGDEFRVERVGGNLALVQTDPLRAFDAAIARVDQAIRNNQHDPEGTLPPMSAAEEAAIERFDRIMRERHGGQGQ